VGIVDDHPIFRLGLKKALERETDLTIEWELGSALNLDATMRREPVDVVLMDLYMGAGKDGIAATRELAERWPEVTVAVISASVDDRSVAASLRAGASAFLPKAMPVSEMAASIRRLANSSESASGTSRRRNSSAQAVSAKSRHAGRIHTSAAAKGLSYRQQEVLEEMRLGRTNREIAARLGISISTVNKHVHQILGVLKVRNRTQAAASASRSSES
jgi:two-component system response regulator NreC